MRALLHRLPAPIRISVEWLPTIGAAAVVVVALKAWVVNPYRIPSSSMEPTLHCSRPTYGCLGASSDRVLANRFIYRLRDPRRGEIAVFSTPPETAHVCGGGEYVKRLIGPPGERLSERRGRVFVDGKKLDEPYVDPVRRDRQSYPPVTVTSGHYYLMGDNRAHSCDSRDWGTVPRANLIGPIFATYRPPGRVGFR